MLYPAASDLYTRWQISKELSQYNEVVEAQKKDYSDVWKAAEEYNRKLASRDGQFAITDEEKEQIFQLLNPLGTGLMGYIDVPRIFVHLPIYQGTEESALQAGAGWWIGTSLPAGGPGTHCVLTAHTGLVKAKMFTDLDQLEIGDTFSVTVLDRVLTYEVDQSVITEPDDLEPLLIQEGQDYMTLYTCYPYGVNTHRLLVRGHRIPTPETVESPVIEQIQRLTGKQIGIMILVLIGLLILILIAVRRRKRKKKDLVQDEKIKKKGNEE